MIPYIHWSVPIPTGYTHCIISAPTVWGWGNEGNNFSSLKFHQQIVLLHLLCQRMEPCLTDNRPSMHIISHPTNFTQQTWDRGRVMTELKESRITELYLVRTWLVRLWYILVLHRHIWTSYYIPMSELLINYQQKCARITHLDWTFVSAKNSSGTQAATTMIPVIYWNWKNKKYM